MKTINYQFFIYFFLTIIYGVISIDNKSTTSKHKTSTENVKCDLRILFSSLNSTKDCLRSTVELAISYPELDKNNLFAYLCTGIVQGVQKICQLSFEKSNTNLIIPKSNTELDNEIKKLSFNKTIQEFCYSMEKLISNSSYIEMTNNETGINKLNKGMHQSCIVMCGSISTPIEPVCSALLWLNKLLTETASRVKIIPKVNESAQSLPAPDNSLAKVTEPQKKEEQASSKTVDSHSHFEPLKNDSAKKHEKLSDIDQKGSKSEPGKDSTAIKSGSKIPEDLSKKKVNNIPEIQPEIGGDTQEKPPKENQGPDPEDYGTREVDPNQSNGAGIEETNLQKMNGPPPEDNGQELKDKIKHEKEAVDEKNDPNIGGGDAKMPDDKDDDLEIDPPATGDLLDVDDQVIAAPPGPPEPPQHFFAYFMAISLTCLVCYIGYHKKQKIMAIVFEGRKSRGGRGRRRPNTANYRKLDCTLEEAVTSQCNSNVTHVIY